MFQTLSERTSFLGLDKFSIRPRTVSCAIVGYYSYSVLSEFLQSAQDSLLNSCRVVMISYPLVDIAGCASLPSLELWGKKKVHAERV